MTATGRIMRWMPWVIVLTAGLLLGSFVWKTFFGQPPRVYQQSFRQGRWMTTADGSPQAYFLKELFVPGAPAHSWIRVTATDSFRVLVNGRTVGTREHPLVNVSGAFPIAHVLHPGRNVIGLYVKRSTLGPARAAVEGGYLDLEGHEHAFFSDGSWTASSHEDGRGQAIPWFAPTFPMNDWSAAILEAVPTTDEVAGLAVHPALAAMPFRGQWLGFDDPHAQSVVFQREFDIDERFQGAWIRIVADERYDLTINGTLIASRDLLDRKLDLHDIGPWLRRGDNTLRVLVAGQRASAPRLALDGILVTEDAVQPLTTSDASWRARQPKGEWRPATVMADHSARQDHLRMTSNTSVAEGGWFGKIRRSGLVCMALVLALVTASWLGFSWYMWTSTPGLAPDDAWLADSILHLPVLLFLTGLYLAQYDTRLDPAFPFQGGFVLAAVALLFLFRAGWWLETRLGARPAPVGLAAKETRSSFLQSSPVSRKVMVGVAVAAIALAGLWLRVENARSTSLSHDEVGMAQATEGIFQYGYPVKERRDGEKTLTTYELVPYPIALSTGLFGVSDLTVRIPAIVFAMLTLLLIAYVGSRVWSVGVGLLAAAVYAFLPFAVVWGSNATHPQQTQFFALLASYLFYRMLRTEPIQPRYAYGTAASFVAAYLSWEGTGLLLVAFFITLLVVRGKNLSWMRSKPVWFATVGAGLVVFLQLSRRVLENEPYMVVGNGKALSGTTLSLVFLDPLYDPFYYFTNLLFAGNHAVLSLAVFLGLPLLLRHRGSRYYLGLVAMLLLMKTNLLPARTIRYAYYLDPFLILAAAAATFWGALALWRLLTEGRFKVVAVAKGFSGAVLVAGLLLLSNNLVFHLYRLQSITQHPMMSPSFHSFPDYRGSAKFVERRIAPGDAVLCLMPHTFEYNAGRPADYYLQTQTGKQIFYSNSPGDEKYLDKYVGSPVLRDSQELQEALHRHRRAWIVAAPIHAFRPTIEPGLVDYVQGNARVVYESYKSKVYLWEQ